MNSSTKSTSPLLDIDNLEGILLVNKHIDVTSFSLIPKFRAIFNEKKIGHGGTLDPLATGLMIYLVGRKYTKTADSYLGGSKEYEATILLGKKTDTYDIYGETTKTCSKVPSLKEVQVAIASFNGEIEQIPPMYSAKKYKGKKLYEYARDGITIPRPAKLVTLETKLISYSYPEIEVSVKCSSGTYIRSIAYDLGEILQCYGCIQKLHRTACGKYTCDMATSFKSIQNTSNLKDLLRSDESIY